MQSSFARPTPNFAQHEEGTIAPEFAEKRVSAFRTTIGGRDALHPRR